MKKRAPRRLTVLSAVDAAMERLLGLTATDYEFHRTDLALGLHMLMGVAPKVGHVLEVPPLLLGAMERLAAVPTEFPPELEWFEVMSRIDALYLRAVRGVALPIFSGTAVISAVARMRDGGLLLPAWLCAELVKPLGLEVHVRLPERPFDDDRLARLAYLTHVVMVETEYLAKPGRVEKAVLDELAKSVPWAQRERQWDMLGELVFCLVHCGRKVRPATVEALLAAQFADGHFEDAGSDERQRAHTTLTCLLALAAVAERA